MKRSDLNNILSAKVNLPHQEVKLATDLIFDVLTQGLADNERIEIRGFGTFYCKERKSFLGINPKTGQRIAISKKFSVAFRPSRDFKNKLNKT